MFLKLETNKPVNAKMNAFNRSQPSHFDPSKTEYIYDLIVNNNDVSYTASELVHKKLQAFPTGSSFVIVKEFKNGKNYINLYDGTTDAPNTVQAAQKAFAPQNYAPMDDAPPPSASDYPGYAQPDMREVKMGRGASYNLSFQYTLQHHPGLTMGTDFFKKVEEYAALIATEQKAFINQQ